MNTFLTFIGGILTGILGFQKTNKQNELEFITKERGDWRQFIREKIPQFLLENKTNAEKIQIKTEIQLRLNPFDDNDAGLIKLMDEYINSNDETKKQLRIKLEDGFSKLLKHDWERVKKETKMNSTFSLKNLALLMILFLCVRCELNCLIENFSFFCPYFFCLIVKILSFIIILNLIQTIKKMIISCIEKTTNYNFILSKLFNINYRK